eukprot:Awhi_evm1s173
MGNTNSIQVHLNDSQLLSENAILKGRVHLNIVNPIRSEGVLLTITSKEEVRFQEPICPFTLLPTSSACKSLSQKRNLKVTSDRVKVNLDNNNDFIEISNEESVYNTETNDGDTTNNVLITNNVLQPVPETQGSELNTTTTLPANLPSAKKIRNNIYLSDNHQQLSMVLYETQSFVTKFDKNENLRNVGVGQYVFPFAIPLPKDLPESISVTDEKGYKVERFYQVKAQVYSSGITSNLLHVQNFTMMSPQLALNMEPDNFSLEYEIKSGKKSNLFSSLISLGTPTNEDMEHLKIISVCLQEEKFFGLNFNQKRRTKVLWKSSDILENLVASQSHLKEGVSSGPVAKKTRTTNFTIPIKYGDHSDAYSSFGSLTNFNFIKRKENSDAVNNADSLMSIDDEPSTQNKGKSRIRRKSEDSANSIKNSAYHNSPDDNDGDTKKITLPN